MKNLMDWSFDPVTAFVTAVFVPLGLYILKLLVRHLKEWTGFLLEAILISLGRIVKRSVASRVSLRKYCRLQLAGQSQHLIVPTSQGAPLDIDKIFIPLTLEEYGRQGRSLNYSEMPNLGKRIRVIGDPGSGKSSLVKRLSRDFCFKALERARTAQLPVISELKTLTIPADVAGDELGVWLYKLIRSEVCKSAVYRMDECFDLYAQSTGLALLLDGLDEVASQEYPRIESAINGLCKHLNGLGENNLVILTMRLQFHQQIYSAYSEVLPDVLHLKPFSPTEIYEFLTRWPFPKQVAAQKVTQIYEELSTRPSLRDMCRNPLVLSMYVAENQASSHLIAPDSRTEFYSKVTTELLIRRRLRQTGPSPGHSKLREQRERILGILSFEHLLDDSQSANSLRWSDGLKVVQDVTGCKIEEAEIIFLDLAKETGIIAEERPHETFRFIHLTFCEFLAAFEAARGKEDGWDKLLDQHRSFIESEHAHLKSRLLEVIPFASALLLPRSRQASSISSLAKVGDRRLLARSFFETKMYEHPDWKVFAEAEQERFMHTQEELWEDDWLRDLHLFNIVAKDAALASSSSKRIPDIDLHGLFRSLAERQQNSLARLLNAYADEDAAAAFFFAEVSGIDLAQQFPELVISSCDQSPFFALVFTRATEPAASARRWRQLLVEAGLRSSVVANYLERAELPDFWRDQLALIPRKERWFANGVLEENRLTQFLTLILREINSADNRACPALQRVGQLPKPGGMSYFSWLETVGNISYLAMISAFPICASVLGDEALRGVAAAFLAVSVVVVFVCTPASLRLTARRLCYDHISNGFSIPRRRSFDFLYTLSRSVLRWGASQNGYLEKVSSIAGSQFRKVIQEETNNSLHAR